MAYTDRNKKTILHSWGRFRGILYAAAAVGDLLACDTSNDGFKLATTTGPATAVAVACEDGAAGETIDMCLAAEVEAPYYLSSGVWTAYTLAASGDETSPLYLSSTAGKASSTSGTTVQQVGYMLSTTKAILCPNTYLTATAISAASLALSTTLGVTGATTLGDTCDITGAVTMASTCDITGASTVGGTLGVTGVLTASGGLSVAAAKAFGLAEKNYTASGAIATSGFVTLSADAADLAMTLAAPTAGTFLIIWDKANSGAKNHVVTATGLTFDGTNDVATFNATAECLVLFATTTTRWIVVENIGSVAFS